MTVVEAGAVAMAVEQVVAGLDKELDRWHVPGLEVAVVRDGEPLFAGGVGVARLDSRAPVTSSTLFRHGSCGKAFTSLLAVLLAEDGVLDLDVPVRRYVPELRLPDPVVAERVTIRDLLSHRSGLARHDLAWIMNPSWSRTEILRRLEHLPMRGDLRAQWQYSNFGYTLAGIAMERATGSGYEDLLRTRLFAAAGFTRTFTIDEDPSAQEDHAEPYLLHGDEPVLTLWRDMPAVAPAGGVVTCADDSVRWLQLQLGVGPIAADVVQRTHHLQAPIPPGMSPFPELRFLGYGMGWVIGTFRGRSLLWHTGGVDGFFTYALLLPDEGIGVVASGNLHMAQLPFAAVLDTADALLGEKPETPWVERLHPEALAAAAAQAEPVAPAPRTGEGGPPAHALGAYVGTFTNAGYGDLSVTCADGALQIRMGEFPVTAGHRHFDTWDLRYEPLEADATATFRTDADGAVSELDVELEDVDGGRITYRRQDGPVAP